MRYLLTAAADVLAPEACAVCGAPGDVACPACLAAMAWTPAVRCARCGQRTPVPAARCPECPAGLARAEQACGYDRGAAALVAALKDHGRRRAAALIAGTIVVRCRPAPRDAVLVPVPLTSARRRQRGHNQSHLIAAHLAVAWGNAVRGDVLQRVVEGAHQRGAGRTARRRQVSGAFAVTGDAPPCVWLVDDVITTGATLSACAHVLRRAGARTVGAVAFARVTRNLDASRLGTGAVSG